ncbi:Qat anti-phage system QueC-like protein QatC [Engelhardtia mirabilis]|uniref:Qat anti-phage system QueC-like protein QatC n=1 Tax=Engelhardtia mirabilis TaxID=2528011 RepID=UPI003AF35974
MKLVIRSEKTAMPSASPEEVGVLLYSGGERGPGGLAIARNYVDEVARLGAPVPQVALDFLTICLGVVAADTFVPRNDAADGWAREFELDVALGDPEPWRELVADLERAFAFLSGDSWSLSFTDGGQDAPKPRRRRKRNRVLDLRDRDSACLFSGGLDSTIGAIDLIAGGRAPLLVSSAGRLDKQAQTAVRRHVGALAPQFALNPAPTTPRGFTRDVSMRTRSLGFIGLGVVAASAVAADVGRTSIDLVIPENGPISLNAPLTSRRIGSLSTRTTHPYLLRALQELLDSVGAPVKLGNPYQFATKGEMVAGCKDSAALSTAAGSTISCGKLQRKAIQCGKCVPCIFRRAAFHHAGIADTTKKGYRYKDLCRALSEPTGRDDVLAMMIACSNGRRTPLRRAVMLGGPLPEDAATRDLMVDVSRRGLGEVASFLRSQGLKC